MHVSFYYCDTPYSPTCTGDNKGKGLGCLCLVSSPEKVSIYIFSRGIFRFKKLWNLWNFLFHSSALVFFPPKKSSCAFSDRGCCGREGDKENSGSLLESIFPFHFTFPAATAGETYHLFVLSLSSPAQWGEDFSLDRRRSGC